MTTRKRTLQSVRQHVHVQSPSELRYWCGRIGCSPAELRAAVYAVGTPVEAIRDHIVHRRTLRSGDVGSCRRSAH